MLNLTDMKKRRKYDREYKQMVVELANAREYFKITKSPFRPLKSSRVLLTKSKPSAKLSTVAASLSKPMKKK